MMKKKYKKKENKDKRNNKTITIRTIRR